MYGKILSNFSAINFGVKALLCAIASHIYSLLLVGDKRINMLTLKISTSRNLTKLLIVMLIVEQLISTRRHDRKEKHYPNEKNPTFFENI
jgi:hypothetical protein